VKPSGQEDKQCKSRIGRLLSCFVLSLRNQEDLMSQVSDLRAAIAQMGTDLGEAITRVEAKIANLGEVDPDLTADIASMREASMKLDALAADPAAPEPAPVPAPEPEATP
jgi:hypothetical protein